MNKISNQYAAMPSLHFGWSLFCACVAGAPAAAPPAPGRGRRSTRVLTLSAIVLTGNHFFLDAAGGAVVFLAGYGLARRFTRPGRSWPTRPRGSRHPACPHGDAAEGEACAASPSGSARFNAELSRPGSGQKAVVIPTIGARAGRRSSPPPACARFRRPGPSRRPGRPGSRRRTWWPTCRPPGTRLPLAGRTEEPGVTEGEDPAVAGHEPVALAGRGGGHADDRLVEADVAGRAEEGGVTEGEDPAVGGHQPVALARRASGVMPTIGLLSLMAPVEP